MRRGSRIAVHSFQRAALVALFALASFTVLPFVHVLSGGCAASAPSCSSDLPAPSHSPDCGVCGSLAHTGARALDAPTAVAAIALSLSRPSAPALLTRRAPVRALDVALARGPPALPSHA
jgi:hypothetical protein